MERNQKRARESKVDQKVAERDGSGRSDAQPNPKGQGQEVGNLEDENLGINAPRGE